MEMEIVALVTLSIALLQGIRSAYGDNHKDKSQAMDTELELRKKILLLEDQLIEQKVLIGKILRRNRRMKKFILDKRWKT